MKHFSGLAILSTCLLSTACGPRNPLPVEAQVNALDMIVDKRPDISNTTFNLATTRPSIGFVVCRKSIRPLPPECHDVENLPVGKSGITVRVISVGSGKVMTYLKELPSATPPSGDPLLPSPVIRGENVGPTGEGYQIGLLAGINGKYFTTSQDWPLIYCSKLNPNSRYWACSVGFILRGAFVAAYWATKDGEHVPTQREAWMVAVAVRNRLISFSK